MDKYIQACLVYFFIFTLFLLEIHVCLTHSWDTWHKWAMKFIKANFLPLM